MEQRKNITNTLIKLFLMLVWWTCLWSLWKGNMVLLMMMILHVMVTILSKFLHLHTPFNKTWLFMVTITLYTRFNDWVVKYVQMSCYLIGNKSINNWINYIIRITNFLRQTINSFLSICIWFIRIIWIKSQVQIYRT